MNFMNLAGKITADLVGMEGKCLILMLENAIAADTPVKLKKILLQFKIPEFLIRHIVTAGPDMTKPPVLG